MKRYFQLRRCCQLGSTAIAIILTALLNSTSVQAADSSQPVTAYQHVNFNGRSLSVGEGEVTIQQLRRSVGNDTISSIAIEPGYSVLACQHSRLRGRCDVFTSDASDLRTISFNDVISSLRISKLANQSPVTVYQHVNFNGNSLAIEQEGITTIQDLRNSTVGNDVISSIQISEGYAVRACEHSRSGGSGRCETFTSSITDLRTIRFNDTISFLSVTRDSVNPDPEPNSAPVASNLSLQTTADSLVRFTLADLENVVTDADGDQLTFEVDLSNGAGNSLTQRENTFTFDPTSRFADLPLGEVVNEVFTYSVADAAGETDTASIIISVEGTAIAPLVFTASVRVTEPNGDVITTGVTVSDALTGDVFSTTDDNGNAVFDIRNSAGNTTLRLTADGFGDQITPLMIVDGAESAALEITMIERVDAPAVSTGDDAQVNIGSSLEPVVSWTGSSFVTESGNRISNDQITLSYTTIDVSNPAELEAFPGGFTGIGINDVPTNNISLGTSEYVFTDSETGAELQLAEGETALITLPLYTDTNPANNAIIDIGETLPIWSLDESTGVWNEETEGVVVASNSSPTGLAVNAPVTHFSWWNVFSPIGTSNVTVRVEGIGLAGTVNVTATPSDVPFIPGNGIVPIGGSYTTAIPNGANYCFSGVAQLTDGRTATTTTVCSDVLAGADRTITLELVAPNAPFAIAADLSPDDFDSFSINGFVGVPAQRVRISAASFESSVDYTAVGLPPGINLVTSSDVAAELVGLPTSDGPFNVTVSGVNADGVTSNSISVNYTINVLPGIPGTPGTPDRPEVLGELLAIVNCELGLIDRLPDGTRIFMSPLFTSVPFVISDSFSSGGYYSIRNGILFQDAVSYQLFDSETFPLPPGLVFNAQLGRFEVDFQDIFDVMDWTGPIFIQLTDGTSGLYDVTFKNDPASC